MEGGRQRIFGDHSLSFSTLASYLDELERSNPGRALDLDIGPIKKKYLLHCILKRRYGILKRSGNEGMVY